MILQLIVFINLARAALQPRDDLVCNDPEISDQCLAGCRLDYLDCRANCDSQFCNSACLAEFQECEGACPCGVDCPTGCVDCPEHSLCEDECENAQINNENYKTCLNEAVDELETCLKSCTPEIGCHDSCYSNYIEMLSFCPCFEEETTTTTEFSTFTTTTTTTTTTTKFNPNDPSNFFILVMSDPIVMSYLVNGDGSFQISATINAPVKDYLDEVRYALVNGKLHIFGGYTDKRKISRLDECTLNELPVRLVEQRSSGHESLSINNGTEAMICFGYIGMINLKSCETFNGTSAVLSTFLTEWTHTGGGLGLYKDQPASVGCWNERHTKAEAFSPSGWNALPEFSFGVIVAQMLVGLDNKSLLFLGGFDAIIGEYSLGIWKLQNDEWSRIGDFLHPACNGSAIKINNSVYYFSPDPKPYPIQRIDITDDGEIENIKAIGNQTGDHYYPVLFQTTSDYCI